MHLVAFMEERFGSPVEIEVCTDGVDAPIAKLFGEEAARLLDNSPRVHKVTGFDTADQKVVEGSITGTTRWPASLAIDTEVKTLDINPTGDDDPLVVAADVLANSLAYLFHHRGPDQLHADLNRPAAVADHPLHQSLDASGTGAGTMWVTGSTAIPRRRHCRDDACQATSTSSLHRSLQSRTGV
jgi:hypothetical protein